MINRHQLSRRIAQQLESGYKASCPTFPQAGQRGGAGTDTGSIVARQLRRPKRTRWGTHVVGSAVPGEPRDRIGRRRPGGRTPISCKLLRVGHAITPWSQQSGQSSGHLTNRPKRPGQTSCTQGLQKRLQLMIGHHIALLPVQASGPAQVLGSRFNVAQVAVGNTSPVVKAGLFRIAGDRIGKGRDRTLNIAQPVARHALKIVRLSLSRIQRDRLLTVLQYARVIF